MDTKTAHARFNGAVFLNWCRVTDYAPRPRLVDANDPRPLADQLARIPNLRHAGDGTDGDEVPINDQEI